MTVPPEQRAMFVESVAKRGVRELPVVTILLLAGVLFFVAPQMILHAALLDAKRELLAELRKEYQQSKAYLRSNRFLSRCRPAPGIRNLRGG